VRKQCDDEEGYELPFPLSCELLGVVGGEVRKSAEGTLWERSGEEEVPEARGTVVAAEEPGAWFEFKDSLCI
jgi:hypothetical protein